MGGKIDSPFAKIRRVVRHVNGSFVPFLAGSLAYHAFLLLGPALVLVLVVVSALGGDPSVAFLREFAEPYLTERSRRLFAGAVRSGAQYPSVVALGTLAIFWSLFRIFRGLDVVFARIYRTETHETVRRQVVDGLIAVVAISVGLLAAMVAGIVAAVFPWKSVTRILDQILLFAVLCLVFFPLYYHVPNVDVTPREVLPGTVVAASGWLLFHLIFQVYTDYAFTLEVYGVLGTVVSVLVWLYASMFILLVGAVINAVLAGRA